MMNIKRIIKMLLFLLGSPFLYILISYFLIGIFVFTLVTDWRDDSFSAIDLINNCY
jgi:hypothetical protein